MKKIMIKEMAGLAALVITMFVYIGLMCAGIIGGTGIILMVLSIIGYGIISAVQTSEKASPKLQNITSYAKIGLVLLLLALSPLINSIAGSV